LIPVESSWFNAQFSCLPCHYWTTFDPYEKETSSQRLLLTESDD
jgi:hypothetical protein